MIGGVETAGRDTLAIVGAGQAACQTISSLRANGHKGRIVLIGEEPLLPYQRPPLSKKYLLGELAEDRLLLRPPQFYADAQVDLHLGVRAEEVERSQGQVRLSDGTRLAFDQLVFATGSRARRLNVPGAELPGVFYLRTVADIDRIRPHFRPNAKLAVVGGGYVGLEVAAVARQLRLEVTLIETAERCLNRVTSPQISSFLEAVHRENGVTIITGDSVQEISGSTHVEGIACLSGAFVRADFVIAGIGGQPNVELAGAMGLPTENGIWVDEFGQTGAEGVFAAGDCTNFPSRLYRRRIRLESVHNAVEQAKCVASTISGKFAAYDQVPWFWSDQYDLKLQIAGLSEGYDNVDVHEEPENRKIVARYYKDGELIAVDAVNATRDYMMGRREIAEQHQPGEQGSDSAGPARAHL